MTSLLNIAGNVPTDAFAEGSSLRFEDGDSAYLSWTPASAGNRKTWTWSGWVKRANLLQGYLFGNLDSSALNGAALGFTSTHNIIWLDFSTGYVSQLETNAVFRDVSAWYHLLVKYDTAQTTASDRIKIYVNNVEQSLSTSTYPSQNYDGYINNTNPHAVGRGGLYNGSYLDGYLANVTFIDGTALTPTSFGEYEDTLWKPKSDTDIQALTFGTNGFYLPMKQTTEAEGFSTVTYTGNGGTQSIEGVGFEPSLVWIKARNFAGHHVLVDSVRGTFSANRYGRLFSNTTGAEDVSSSDTVTSLDADGFGVNSAGSGSYVNDTGDSYVAWCWDAGTGSPVSNTDGSITSTVKANTAKGFSIVSWNASSTSATVGHGLGVRPDLVIMKTRDSAIGWPVQCSALGDMTSSYLFLNTTSAKLTGTTWSDATATTFGTSSSIVKSGDDYIAYCFHSVSGYSDFGSYSGTGASGNTVTTGFKPAFVMIKRTDSTSGWTILDNTRNPDGLATKELYANDSAAEASGSSNYTATATGFDLTTTNSWVNASGGTYIYMAFADTRDATFFGDTSGNGNNWTPNKLNNTDVVPDSPATNFATFNSLVNVTGGSFSEGNLKVTTGSSAYGAAISSFAVSSGKWYSEFLTTASSGDQRIGGVRVSTNLTTTYDLGNSGSFAYRQNDGQKKVDGTQSSYGATWAANDIIGMALNLDDDEVTFYKNGSSQGTFSITAGEYFLATSDGDSGAGMGAFVNFGQDSSFAGNETPQGNTDDNGQGDFYYAPPSGFLALCRNNLPAPAITAPDEYFNTVTYIGTGTTNSITGVGFQPDWVWGKQRNGANSHELYDAVRGVNQIIYSDLTDAEGTNANGISSFDSDGFTVAGATSINGSGNSVVAWNWLAGNGTVSNTSGSITSQVSANQTAGFSIATYSGNGTAGASIGHGLSSAPDMVIVKDRTSTGFWAVYHAGVDATAPEDYLMRLNTTDARLNGSVYWNDTAPTSSVFTVGTSSTVNNSSRDYVAYCFHSVEGYSKIGSYTGNGSTDGTFVHCGFRPAFVMVKRTDSISSWYILDNKRNGFNPDNTELSPESSASEADFDRFDFTSNGFKIRQSYSGTNASGGSFIFLAFAEAPFKSANAR